MGDIVACEPVARYLKLNDPTGHLAWAVAPAFRELIDTNPFIDETITLDCLTEWMRLQNHGKFDKFIDLHANYRICQHCQIPLVKRHGNPFVTVFEWFDHGALLEAFSLGAGLPSLSAQPRLYLRAEHVEAVDAIGLPERFCVIHRISNDPIKDWTEDGWLQLVAHVSGRLGLKVIEVGAGQTGSLPKPLPGTIDMVNRLPLLQTAEVIRRASMFIGIDSGPAHLANALMIPGVVLLGRLGYFRQYLPFTGFYAGSSPLVRIVRHLTKHTRDLTVAEVTDAVSYVAAAVEHAKPGRPPLATTAMPRWAPPTSDRSDTILESELFDTGWLAVHNPQILESTVHPADQYLSDPSLFTVKPGAAFDSAQYLRDHDDVARAVVNPLLHYLDNPPRDRTDLRFQRLRLRQSVGAMAAADALAERTRDAEFPPQPQPLPDTVGKDGMPLVFAFHLPQFHPIPENDWAHGKGFTEWNNVTKAKPLFRGHYQPKIPGELGYYDLRAADVLREQIKLAREHGISGFCFYYYYFKGRKLLYRPIETFVKSDIDAPFMLIWANENWTKRWDGGNDEIIIGQDHSSEDDLAFLRELVPLFSDRRYVKVNGKPVLMIYKVHLFPDIRATVELWRTEIVKLGFPGIYLVMVDDWTQRLDHPRDFGFDASYEIPSNIVPSDVMSDETDGLDLVSGFDGRIVDYPKFARYHMGRPTPNYRRFRTVMLPWDNTARYGMRAMVHINGLGESYRLWLMQALIDTSRTHPPAERFVFLHSWNEWCEGTYLEPDGKHGRFFLDETRMAIDLSRQALGLTVANSPEGLSAQLLRLQRAKDEGAGQVLRAIRLESHYIWRDLMQHQTEMASLRAEVEALHGHTANLTARESEAVRTAENHLKMIEAFRNSTSWRVTAPLRAITARLRGR
jgi:ADP-heptose:LPS heptosyltransferase